MKTVILWSGGIDSTSLLLYLLRETTDEVIAHHIHFHDVEGKAAVEKIEKDDASIPTGSYQKRFWISKAERLAVASLREKLKSERDFTYVETGVVPLPGAHSYQYYRDMLDGAITVLHFKADRLVTGHHMDDVSVRARQRDILRQKLFSMCMSDGYPISRGEFQSHQAVLQFPLRQLKRGKKENVQYLPPDLRALTMYCDSPRVSDTSWHHCGDCFRCKKIKDLIQEIS